MQKILKLLAENSKIGYFKAESNNDEATIYVYDSIVASDADARFWGGVSAESFVKTVRDLKVKVIHLRLNSPGGDVFAGRAMEQALREHEAKVIVHIDGYAASAASFVAMAGDEILIGKGSFVMIHKAWTIAMGNANDFLDTASLLEKVDGTIAQTYADRTGQDVKAISKMMEDETWLTADEAVANGFADKIADEAVKNESSGIKWNMAAYDRAPTNANAKDEPQNNPQQLAQKETVNVDDLRRRLQLATMAA